MRSLGNPRGHCGTLSKADGIAQLLFSRQSGLRGCVACGLTGVSTSDMLLKKQIVFSSTSSYSIIEHMGNAMCLGGVPLVSAPRVPKALPRGLPKHQISSETYKLRPMQSGSDSILAASLRVLSAFRIGMFLHTAGITINTFEMNANLTNKYPS